jgi:hypothetical protein
LDFGFWNSLHKTTLKGLCGKGGKGKKQKAKEEAEAKAKAEEVVADVNKQGVGRSFRLRAFISAPLNERKGSTIHTIMFRHCSTKILANLIAAEGRKKR